MRHMRTSLALALLATAPAAAQQAQDGLTVAQRLAAHRGPVTALTNVRVVDGTGAPARDGQTIVIEGRTIRAVGPAASVTVPANAQVLDLAGHTVIPGIVGLHDHMYYQMRPQLQTYPLLFLGAGVTTVRTTGSTDVYGELNLRELVKRGDAVGPEVFVTGPYLQGSNGGFGGVMYEVKNQEDARRVVRYWAEEGVSWFKAYTTITRENLKAAIEEAHKHGVKVTAHLCSVTFREAVALGIDALEHGFTTDTEYHAGKQPDVCPQGASAQYGSVDINGPEVQATIRDMVKAGVPLTSTLAVSELSAPSRVPFDQRVIDAMHPDLRPSITRFYENGKNAQDQQQRAVLRKAMDFERAFVKAGGLLGAGADPCCLSVIAGFGDQRNYELLVEAGFTPEEAVQIMTSNSAKILGIHERVGTIRPGMQADLVVIAGDPTRDAADIRKVRTVFKFGLGYDAQRLLDMTKGRVGFR